MEAFILSSNFFTTISQQCSVQCGTGTRRRLQRCTRVYKPDVPGTSRRKEYIDDSFCTRLKVTKKPMSRQSIKICNINCKWKTSEWSRCDNCTQEYQTRFVRCEARQKNRAVYVNEQYCPGKRPAHLFCNL